MTKKLKRKRKLSGRVKCHGNKSICVMEHGVPGETPKGTKPKPKKKKIYAKRNKI